jgi:glycosyltransferase involved in cell wall biosynthesis
MIALTERTKAALISEGADPEKITVLPHFIDTKRFTPRLPTAASHAETPLTILFVGRLEEEKGVFDVLASFSELRKKLKLSDGELRLKMVGSGSQQAKLEAIAAELGLDWHSIHESANYDEMPDVYRSADMFVAPSKPTRYWEEQYCTALLEAQAAGLPILTTETGGIPENVGDAAVLVPPGNRAEITKALAKFVGSPALRKSYGVKARKRAVSVHDAAIGARKLAAIYDRVLTGA